MENITGIGLVYAEQVEQCEKRIAELKHEISKGRYKASWVAKFEESIREEEAKLNEYKSKI